MKLRNVSPRLLLSGCPSAPNGPQDRNSLTFSMMIVSTYSSLAHFRMSQAEERDWSLRGRPRNDQSRSSAWLILKWASELYVETIIIENVKEFRSWGPLGADGQPLKSKRGETFLSFIAALRSLGYTVEFRTLVAANYGDPTTRERLVIVARRGGKKIIWPEPT